MTRSDSADPRAQNALDAERLERLDSLPLRVGEIKRLAGRLETRHVALLEKSLQVTEAIEARWIEAQDEARDLGRQRDSVVHLLEGTRRQLESTQAELDRARDQLQEAVEAAEAELAERDDSIQHLENDLAEARRALDQQLQEWQLDQQQSQEGISILLAERDQARAEIDQLVHRLSWRITAPLRTALTWLRRLRS